MQLRFKKLFFTVLVAALAMSGCSSSSSDSDSSTTDDGAGVAVTVGASKYVVPDDVQVLGSVPDTNAVLLTAGDNQEVGSFINEVDANTTTAAVARFGTSTTLATTAKMNDFYTLLGNEAYISSISSISKIEFTSPAMFTVGDYSLSTLTPYAPLDLAGEILSSLSAKKLTTLPTASANAPKTDNFRLIVAIILFEGKYYYVVSVLPDNYYNKFAATVTAMSNGSNVASPTATEIAGSDSFTQQGGNNIADFLFVIDNSGSMGDDQDAIAQAARDFGQAMQNAGIDFNAAITSTELSETSSTGYVKVIQNAGIIDNNITELEQKVVIGTYGSATEQGIRTAELALSRADRNDTDGDGPLVALNFPRSGASVAVILLSDEPSQYYYDGSYHDFNLSDNLFTRNNILFHSIIQTSECSSYDHTGYYDDLSTATGGQIGAICHRDSNGSLDFSDVMQKIAINAGGSTNTFVLSHKNVIVSTIEVRVNGNLVPLSTENGYNYNASRNAISFYGNALPQVNDTITVTYRYYQ